MGRIKDKDLDTIITGGENLLASDVDGKTVNITINSLASYLSTFITGSSQGGSLSFIYDSDVTAGASAGTFRLDNADATLATKLYVSDSDTLGVDTPGIINNMNVGAKVLLKQQTEFELYEITGKTDQAGYYELDVTHDDSSTGVLTTSSSVDFTFYNLGTVATADNSLSEVDQTVADAVVRNVNTVNTGYITFSQDGTDILRVGNNNDQAVYLKSIEAMSGSTVPFVSVPQLPLRDTGTDVATNYSNGLVKDSTTGELFYSDGTSWFNLSSTKHLAGVDQSLPTAVARRIDVQSGTGSQLNFFVDNTEVMRFTGSLTDRVSIEGIQSVGANNVTFYTPPALPEIDTGLTAASLHPGALVKDTGTVYFSNGTTWTALSAQATGDLIIKDGSSPNTINNYYYGTQAQIDAIGTKDANTIYIPSNGVSPATPVSTADISTVSNVADLATTGGHLYNMGTASTFTGPYTTANPTLNGWAQIRINSTSEPAVTGATKSGGIPFVASTDMYLNIRYNGSRTEFWFDTY